MRVTSPSPISPIIAAYLENLSPAHVTRRLNFYDDFNRLAEDTDVWTSGGDDGLFGVYSTMEEPTAWSLATGAVINNDRYIHGNAVTKNKRFTPMEDGHTTVTWEARLKFTSIADISALWGLFLNALVDYDEPASDCAQFFADTAITNTFRVRTWRPAEEETDTLVALDTDWHKFRIVWTAASVLFYIDDVLVATHAAGVPTYQLLSEILIRTEAAVAKSMRLDYVHVEVS